MKPPVPLLPGERVIYSSVRGVDAGHSGWWWLLAMFGGMQACNVLMYAGFALRHPEDTPASAASSRRPRPAATSC